MCSPHESSPRYHLSVGIIDGVSLHAQTISTDTAVAWNIREGPYTNQTSQTLEIPGIKITY